MTEETKTTESYTLEDIEKMILRLRKKGAMMVQVADIIVDFRKESQTEKTVGFTQDQIGERTSIEATEDEDEPE